MISALYRRIFNNKKLAFALALFFIFNLIIFAGSSLLFVKSRKETPDTEREFPLLAKRIQRENPPDIMINFSSLNTQVEEYMNTVGGSYNVYFEYLATGTSINIGEQNEIIGASLLKLPIVMNLYKAYEENRIQPSDKITLRAEWLNKEYGSLWEKGAGAQITYQEAVHHALVNSDNTAILAIAESSQGLLPTGQETLLSVDTTIKIDDQGRALLTAESYGSILKCLYFSCFLEKHHSDEILQMLTKSTGKHLSLRIPNQIPVAHKIGQWREEMLSDCGIIYVPSRAYLLCVMIAQNPEQASNHIANISKVIYDYVQQGNSASINSSQEKSE